VPSRECRPRARSRWSPTDNAPGAGRDYDRGMPRLWMASLVILVACLIASMVIAIVKLS
jgi:hypothetical protein